MKAYEVSYQKGHLVDRQSGKRIFLKRGGSFYITGDDNQFEEKDDLLLESQVLGSDEKLESLKKMFKSQNLEKIADANTKFRYQIGISKTTEEDKARSFVFDCTILEDLYLKEGKGNNNK